jgi:hypothetical protein
MAQPDAEEVMKAVFALILIYVGAFLVAIQGSSPSAAQAASQSGTSKQFSTAANATSIDPVKEADIRALLELVGARDQIQDSVKLTAEQYREKLLLTVQNNEQGQAFINSVITQYEKNFDVDQVTDRLLALYDKHYSEDEIKTLLQFYGSPVGQKVAAESPKIAREVQETTRAAASQAAKDALAHVKQQNPGVGQNARLGNPPARRFQQRQKQTPDTTQQTAQQQEQP